jgi:quinol monooxygenase YgiN
MLSSKPASPAIGGKHVIIVLLLHLKPGREALVLEDTRSVRDRSRREAGCLLFDIYRLADDPGQLFLHEVWESRDAMEAHASNFHTSRFRAAINAYLEDPIQTFEVLEID